MRFNKKDLIAEMQSRGMTKAEATKAVDIALDSITSLLKTNREAGVSLTLRDFGTFSVSHHPARMARNPSTGAQILLPDRNGVRFKAAEALKQAVN